MPSRFSMRASARAIISEDFVSARRASRARFLIRLWFVGCRSGNQDRKGGSFSHLAIHSDLPAMRGNDLLADEEAEAQAADRIGGDGALESLENPFLVFRFDSDAMVGDADAGVAVRFSEL